MTSSDRWRFEWLTTWDEVWDPAFVSQWQKWIDESPTAHVFFEPCVARAWVDTYIALRDIEPRFMIARLGTDCIVFFPLILDRGSWKDAWQRVLQPVGYNEYDYHDPILIGRPSREIWPGFWKGFETETARASGADVVILHRVREPCVVAHAGFSEANRAPFVDLSRHGSFNDLLLSRSKALRKDVRRQEKRVENLGPLRIRIFGQDDAGSAIQAVRFFLQEHAKRWPSSYRARGFHERLVSYTLPCGFLHFSVLEAGAVPLSWKIGFFHKRRFYFYVSAVNSEMVTYSPGKLHLVKVLQEAMNLGAATFDFLTGEEEYKMHWADGSVALHCLSQRLPGLRPWVRNTSRKVLRRGASLVLRRPT